MGSDPHALDVRDLPTGAPPAVPLVTNGDLAAAETGEAVVRWTPDGVVVETGGQTFGPYPSSHGLARNDNGTAVAWATDEGDVMVYADGAGQPEQVMHSDLVSLEVAALTGTDCIRGKASDCTYYVNGYNMETNESEAFTISGDGGTGPADVPDPSILAVTDATTDGRVLGLSEIRDDGSCSAAFDPASGSTPLLETCDHTLDAFSPNGDYVLASESYHDGIGSNRIAVYAAAGDLMADRANTDRRLVFYNDAVWEDDTHVLFSVYSDGMWSIVRMDVNGAMEYAVPPQEGEAEQVPWHFETR
jgi:hypothetical protein